MARSSWLEMTSSEQPQVLGFGTSPDGRLFALAFDDAIQVCAAWDAPATAVLQWPSGQEGLPPGYCVSGEIDKAHITQLVVFPDGQRALLALREGVFVVSRSGATRLLPGPERYIEHFEWLRKEYPNDPLTLTIDMEHGAVSPRGDFVLAGCQDSKHSVRQRAQTDCYAWSVFRSIRINHAATCQSSTARSAAKKTPPTTHRRGSSCDDPDHHRFLPSMVVPGTASRSKSSNSLALTATFGLSKSGLPVDQSGDSE
jgi:hypothetical protein